MTEPILHILSSFLIFIFLCEYLNFKKSFIITLLIGICKEQFDVYVIGSFFNWFDLLFNLIGILIALWLAKK